MATTFSICYYRPAALGQIGPQAEYEELEATSKTRAIAAAKAIAKERGWRYMTIAPGAGGRMAFVAG